MENRKTKALFTAGIALVMLVAFALILAAAIGIPVALAYAEGEDQEEVLPEEAAPEEKTDTPVIVIEQPEEEDSLSKVFKESILPYIVSAGSMALTILIMIAPYIKIRGQNKTLQGMYTVASKSIEQYKERLSAITESGIVDKIATGIIPELKDYILSSVKDAVKENVKDTTGDLASLQTDLSVLSAQTTNLIKAACLTWGEVDGVKEILSKSPTAQVLTDYLTQIKAIRAQVDAQNAEAVKPIDDVIEELEVYGDEDE